MRYTAQTFRVKFFTIVVLLCFSSGFLIADQVALRQVKSFSDDIKTRIIFESNRPLTYSAYTTEDKPDVIVIDFPDTVLKGIDNVLNILTKEVKNITFDNIPLGANAFIARAEIDLTSILSYHISQHRNFLYIDILSENGNQTVSPQKIFTNVSTKVKKTPDMDGSLLGQNETTRVSHKAIVATPPEKVASFDSYSMPYLLNEITYDMESDNITVNLFHTGDPEYSSFELESPDRLIIDFHSTVNKLSPRKVNLNTHHLNKIRSAQFQSDPVNITRVVFDVNKPYSYKIFKSNGCVKVAIGNSAYIADLQIPLDTPGEKMFADNSVSGEGSQAGTISDSAEASMQTVDLSQGIPGNAVAIGNESQISNEDKGRTDTSLFETANTAGMQADDTLVGDSAEAEDLTPESGKTKKLFDDQSYDESLVTEGKKYVGESIGLVFKDADIKDVIQIIGDVTGKNFIVDQRVKGKVTINFKSVPWDQALDIILSLNNLGMEEENNIIVIASLAKLEEKHRKEKKLEEERILSGPTDVITRRISYAKADEVKNIVESYLTSRGNVIVDKRTNLLLIRELRGRMQTILDLIDRLDIPTRQVNIEARVIETNKNYQKDLGIQWGWQAIADDEHGNATRYLFPHDITVQGSTMNTGLSGVPYAVNLPPGAPTSGIAFTMGNVLNTVRIDAALQAMEETGQGRILSSPSVATQNNIEATILSGAKIPYTSIVDNTASVSFIQAKLELRVTPQITSDDTIIMEVTVEKTEPDYSRLITNVQGALPTILEKKVESTMLVKDGGTAVIGGILQVNDSESERRVPFFHKIPLIGALFKANNWQRSDSELLIFITPKILGYN